MTTSPIGIVRWTLAAFHANEHAGDDELVDILEAAGLPHAARAVIMVPLAYGRRILDGLVTLPATYLDGDRELALAGDEIFIAADHLARTEASRKDLDRVGLRSAEVNAVNAALHAGRAPNDLVLSPPVMTIRDRVVPVQPEAEAMLDDLVRAHGSSLALVARQFPGSITRGRVQMQLDIVATAGEREITESFSGLGATLHDALGEAIKKFRTGTLHVLLAVLDRRELGADQVMWESWGGFDACLGSLLRMWSPTPAHMGAYLDALKASLLAANLPAEVHWVRTFIATDGKRQLGLDMLVDNQPWEPGEQLTRAWPWPVTEAPYALRHFFMLVPAKRQGLPARVGSSAP